MKVHDDLRTLASGINHILADMNQGKAPEFLLVVVVPSGEGEVLLNTITGIQEPHKIAQIGQHLIDMAKAQLEPSLDPDSDTDVRGHA